MFHFVIEVKHSISDHRNQPFLCPSLPSNYLWRLLSGFAMSSSFVRIVQDIPLDLDIEEVKGRLTEWIAQEQVAAEIKRRFRHFLRNYPNDNPNGQLPPGSARQSEIYMERVRAMCKGRFAELEWAGINMTVLKSQPCNDWRISCSMLHFGMICRAPALSCLSAFFAG